MSWLSSASYALPFSASSSSLSHGRRNKGIVAMKWIHRIPISPKHIDSPSSRVSSHPHGYICSMKNPTVNPVNDRKPSDELLTVSISSDRDVSASDHWRKNISFLSKRNRVYSIDLIGYDYSEKPNPRDFEPESFYTFETWTAQPNEFCAYVVKDDAFFICNSIGGVVGLQAAIK